MKVAVIGAGASGMMAAISAARAGARVTCLERNEKAGKKLYATGNGRCNFSNLSMDSKDFHVGDWYYTDGPELLEKAFDRFGVKEVCRFFQECGMLYADRDGYLYPYSGQAATVVLTLERELAQVKVTLVTGARVIAVELCPDGRFELMLENGKSALFDRVIFACGGKAAPVFGSDGNGYALVQKLGHHANAVRPSLCAIRCKETFIFKKLSGVRARARVRLLSPEGVVTQDIGELQLTDYGISGIPTFQISHCAGALLAQNRTPSIEIDFLPDFTLEALEELLSPARTEKATYQDLFGGMVHRKVLDCILTQCGLGFGNVADRAAIKKVLHSLKALRVTAVSLNDFSQAQVTAGGVALSEITENFESRLVPGVYLCGELLNVDGKCGGYNLQWAWSSGWLAGSACAGRSLI